MQVFITRVHRDPVLAVEISGAVKAFLGDVDALCAKLSAEYPSS